MFLVCTDCIENNINIFPHSIYFCGRSWGPSASFGLIYLTGFPGGLDYFMLGLTKLGIMDRLQEKSVNASVNAWIRGPGCTISAAWTWAAWREGKMTAPTIAILINLGALNSFFISSQYNSIFFSI